MNHKIFMKPVGDIFLFDNVYVIIMFTTPIPAHLFDRVCMTRGPCCGPKHLPVLKVYI